jgi:hypothetical protein
VAPFDGGMPVIVVDGTSAITIMSIICTTGLDRLGAAAGPGALAPKG